MAFRLEDYKVGWITALPIEAAAAKAMLDTIHPRLSSPDQDSNIYTFGHIGPGHGVLNGGHNVVIASGRPGAANAAAVANDMRRTFPWLRIALMVGIAGGIGVRTRMFALGTSWLAFTHLAKLVSSSMTTASRYRIKTLSRRVR